MCTCTLFIIIKHFTSRTVTSGITLPWVPVFDALSTVRATSRAVFLWRITTKKCGFVFRNNLFLLCVFYTEISRTSGIPFWKYTPLNYSIISFSRRWLKNTFYKTLKICFSFVRMVVVLSHQHLAVCKRLI